MGNKIFKIALPLIILGVIALVIYRTQKAIDSIETEVTSFNFSDYINNMVQSDLKDKPYNQAKNEYRRIYDIIKTEEQLVATDSMGNPLSLLSDTAAQGCYRKVFQGYWPAFERMVDGVFKSDWSNIADDQLNIIKVESEDLQHRNGSAMRNDSLTHYLAYIGDYEAAKKFNTYCASKSQYETKVAQAAAYKKKYPLCNNISLKKKMENVPQNAQISWAKQVKKSVTDACQKYNLDDFLSAKSQCDSKISEYNKYFSNAKLSANETTTVLKNKWYYLLEVAVDKACQIYDYTVFSHENTYLRAQIDAYEKAYVSSLSSNEKKSLSDLKARLTAWNNNLLN